MILLLALLAPAHAAAPFLVSTWQPRNPEAAGLAGMLEDYLARELARNPDLALLRVDDTPDFEDYSARIYMDGCPPGNIIGCTQVVAERGKADYAITGTVQSLAEGSRVEVDILDIRGSRVMVTFKSDLAVGEDRTFAEGVARVVAAAVKGEVGGEVDIREDTEESTLDKDAVARQLEELGQQLSEAKLSIGEGDREIERTTYTIDDLAKRMETEGAKPWERLDMTPAAYLRYKNSGLPLFEWRQRAVGRQGQLLIHGAGMFWNGPVRGEFYARYAVDGVQTVDSYAYQTVGSAIAGGGAASVGFGLLPFLEVGAHGAISTGSFVVDVNDQQVDRAPDYSEPINFFVTDLVVGPYAQATFLPVSRIRPTAGLALDWVQQHAVGEFYEMPASVHTFPVQPVVLASLIPGGEVSLTDHLDFTLRVPLDLLLAGGEAQSERSGTVDAVDALTPPTPAPVSFRVEAGLTVRLFGKDTSGDVVYDDFEEP